MTDREVFERMTQLREQKVEVCLATVVEALGSTPREVGAKMLVCADATTYGSVGGGCGERQVKAAALRCLLASRDPEVVEVDLTDDLGTRGGDVCGGKMRIFVERC